MRSDWKRRLGSPRARTAARAILLAALERDPGDWELWYDLALASEGGGRARAAARARALNPLAPELTGLPPSRGTPQDP
jgi:predicted Zn-dependent protease